MKKFECTSISNFAEKGVCVWFRKTLHVDCGCVHLASLGRPRSAPVHSKSFEGAHLGQPPVPCLWSGSSLGVTWGACRHHERASVIVGSALVRGSAEWALRGRPREAKRMHPVWVTCLVLGLLPWLLSSKMANKKKYYKLLQSRQKIVRIGFGWLHINRSEV